MSPQPSADPKRILIAVALIAFMLLGFELLSYYLFKGSPEKDLPPPKEEPKIEKVKEEKKPIPSLMLGTTREKKNLGEVLGFDFGSFRVEISTVGGRVVKFVDRAFGFDLITDAERKLKLFPLEIYTGDPDLDYEINFGTYRISRDGDRVYMDLVSDRVKLRKVLEFKDFYFIFRLETDLKNVYVLAGTYPFERSFYMHEGPVMKINGEVLRVDVEDVKGKKVYEGKVEFAGEESRYFFKGFKGDIDRVILDGVSYRPEGEEKEKRVTFTYVEYKKPLLLYMGAKYYSRLREVGLQDLLDWGILKIFVRPLFVFMYWVFEHTGSWVLSIVILTFLLRLLFFPLNYKSTTSMMKLQEAAPRLEKIRKKYKDDPVKMQEEMMKLYSEIGFNPMSGCLPILVQIPVFFALYKVLIITVDLKLSGLLWIPSLADKDPFYVLPVVMGLTMILQQKLTPNPDPKQNLVMYISAVAFTFLFANFPSGLVLYWTVNNILNIGQNYLIKNVILKSS